jgi:hypothetical protein
LSMSGECNWRWTLQICYRWIANQLKLQIRAVTKTVWTGSVVRTTHVARRRRCRITKERWRKIVSISIVEYIQTLFCPTVKYSKHPFECHDISYATVECQLLAHSFPNIPSSVAKTHTHSSNDPVCIPCLDNS